MDMDRCSSHAIWRQAPAASVPQQETAGLKTLAMSLGPQPGGEALESGQPATHEEQPSSESHRLTALHSKNPQLADTVSLSTEAQ